MGDMSNTDVLRSNLSPTYMRRPLGSSSASPTSAFKMDIFNHGSTSAKGQIYGTSPTAERHPTDRNSAMPALVASNSDPMSFGGAPSISIRKLAKDSSMESVKSLLTFVDGHFEVQFVQSHLPEDHDFRAAIVRFSTTSDAMKARQSLNGKLNANNTSNLIVDLYDSAPMSHIDQRRNTVDGTAARTQTSSTSSNSSVGPITSGRSRYNNTFQSVDRISPPLMSSSSGGNSDYPYSENTARMQSFFSPQSPLTNAVNGHHRVSGKSMINDDSVDDETGELLKDPVAYAKNGQQPAARRSTNPQALVGRLGSLSLNSPNGGQFGPASANGYASPRGNGSMQHTLSHQMSPSNASNGGPNGSYISNYPHAQYPPVNPADQNPPCNTLYVGNLPIDTNEDELKSLFSKQRGYKRLCFRTKQNGPMCFVEFEDVSFATKALNELYGHPLHNSVKGGIRLSFSKNPLGVRPGQTSGLGPNAAMSPQAMTPGYASSMNGFSSAVGPPPGLSQQPGLPNGVSYRPLPNTGMDGMFQAFAVQQPEFSSQLGPRNAYSGGVPPNMPGMYGRDSRNNSYSEYAPRK